MVTCRLITDSRHHQFLLFNSTREPGENCTWLRFPPHGRLWSPNETTWKDRRKGLESCSPTFRYLYPKFGLSISLVRYEPAEIPRYGSCRLHQSGQIEGRSFNVSWPWRTHTFEQQAISSVEWHITFIAKHQDSSRRAIKLRLPNDFQFQLGRVPAPSSRTSDHIMRS